MQHPAGRAGDGRIQCGAARPRRAAGALIGSAVFVKVYALILLPWLALARRHDVRARVHGGPGGGSAVAGSVYGWDGNLALLAGWFHTVTSTTEPNLLLRHAISFAAMWAKWLGPGPIAAMLALASVIAGVGRGALCVAASAVGRGSRLSRGGIPADAGSAPLAAGLGLRAAARGAGDDRPDGSMDGDDDALAALTVAGFFMANLTTFDTVGQHNYMLVTTYAVVSIGAIAKLASLVHVRVRGLA